MWFVYLVGPNSAQPTHLFYINIQGRNKKIFSFVSMVQMKILLRPFQILPTFIDNITRYPLSGSVLFRQKSPIALRHFTDSVILLPLEFGFRADFVQRRKSSFLRLKICIRLPLKLSFSRALICAKFFLTCFFTLSTNLHW